MAMSVLRAEAIARSTIISNFIQCLGHFPFFLCGHSSFSGVIHGVLKVIIQTLKKTKKTEEDRYTYSYQSHLYRKDNISR